jgi:hypothetical protein
VRGEGLDLPPSDGNRVKRFASLDARIRAAIVQGTRTPPSHGGNPGSNPGSGTLLAPRVYGALRVLGVGGANRSANPIRPVGYARAPNEARFAAARATDRRTPARRELRRRMDRRRRSDAAERERGRADGMGACARLDGRGLALLLGASTAAAARAGAGASRRQLGSRSAAAAAVRSLRRGDPRGTRTPGRAGEVLRGCLQACRVRWAGAGGELVAETGQAVSEVPARGRPGFQ